MSHSVPQQQSRADAARGDAPSAPSADRPLPGFPQHANPHSPIEREIERSERASAALAATRALTRASFTDSQLAADDLAADDDIDTSGWIRTEYAGLDAARSSQDDAAKAAPRNFVGGTFNPGIASLEGRPFPSASLAQAPIKTRTGAQARFMHEARTAPRGDRAPNTMSLATGQSTYDKPAVVPMLAPAAMAPGPVKTPVPTPRRVHAEASEPVKFMLAAGLGAVAVLIAGGVAWKAGMLPHNSAANAAAITAQVAAEAEAARLLSAPAKQPIAITPGAGATPARSNEEIDAALAAAARAAAVPVASVHAAGPARVSRPVTQVAAPVAATPTPAVAPAVAPATPPRASAKGKESVADAVARAQARADSFLTSGSVATPPASPAAKPEQ